MKVKSPRALNEDNLLGSNLLSSTPINDDDCLLLNTDDDGADPGGLLNGHQGNDDSMILNLLDDAMNEDEFAQNILVYGNKSITPRMLAA